MTNNDELALKLESAAEKASGGEWVRESGEGWEAICSDDDQVNGGFIICSFQGNDDESNRKFVQGASPANILALLAERHADKKRIAELESLTAEQDKRLVSYAAIATKNAMSVKPAEQYADDSELSFSIGLNDDCENYQTAQWLKELRRRRAAGIKLEVGE